MWFQSSTVTNRFALFMELLASDGTRVHSAAIRAKLDSSRFDVN
jgi:hypothetical protein